MSFPDITIDTNEEEEIPVGLHGEGSLNAGVELDHEDLFVDPTPGEVPELAVDVELLVTLEAQLDDLAYLRQDMERTHGMTQSFAMEAERILPGSLGVPVGYFTKDPSATRYAISLEALSKGVWAIIVAAAAAVAAAIVKFYLWITGNPSSNTKDPEKAAKAAEKKAEENESKAEENVEQMQEAAKSVSKMRQVFDAGDLYPKGQPPDTSRPLEATVDDLVNALLTESDRFERTKRFMRMDNPIYRDILTEGPYTRAFRQVAGRLPEISARMRERAGMISAAIIRDLQPHGLVERGQNLRDLVIATQPFQLVVDGKALSPGQCADYFVSIRTRAEHSHGQPKPMNLDQVLDAMQRSYENSNIVQFFQYQRDVIDASSQMDQKLAILQKEMTNVASDGLPGKSSEGVGAAIRDAVFTFGQEFNGFRRLIFELYIYGSHLDRVCMEAMGLVASLEARLFTMAKTGKFNMPTDWKLAGARAAMGRYQNLFSHVNPKAFKEGGNWL